MRFKQKLLTKLASSLLVFTLISNSFAEVVSKINVSDEDYNTLTIW